MTKRKKTSRPASAGLWWCSPTARNSGATELKTPDTANAATPASAARTKTDTTSAGTPSRCSRKLNAWRGTVDRKSTRLNSSHVKISYAVFCLKKKKNKKKKNSTTKHKQQKQIYHTQPQ